MEANDIYIFWVEYCIETLAILFMSVVTDIIKWTYDHSTAKFKAKIFSQKTL